MYTLEFIYNKYSPDLFFFGHTYETRDWVPRLSARLNMPFISDSTNFNFENELSFLRPIYQAKLNERIVLDNKGIVDFTLIPGVIQVTGLLVKSVSVYISKPLLLFLNVFRNFYIQSQVFDNIPIVILNLFYHF